MRLVNATRCIVWAAKRLNGLWSSLLPATTRVRKTIKLIRNLLLQRLGESGRGARGRQRSMDKPATGAKANAQWDREFSQLWDEPFPRQRLS